MSLISQSLKGLSTSQRNQAISTAIDNGSMALEVIALAKLGKSFPTYQYRRGDLDHIKLPGEFDTSTVPLPKIKSKGPLEALAPLASEDATRCVLNGVYFDHANQCAVATDGSALACLPGPVSKEEAGIASTVSKALWGSKIDGNYPNWKHVVPNDSLFSCQLDVDKVRRMAIACAAINRPFGRMFANLWFKECLMDPSYVVNAINFLLSSGVKAITFHFIDNMSPIRLVGDTGAYVVIMPRRVVGGAVSLRTDGVVFLRPV